MARQHVQQAQQQAPQPDIAPGEVELAREVMREQGEDFTLAEMTRIMDVAGTLRREQALVEQQLNLDELKAELRQRLLAAAQVSGDAVTPEQVDAAVEHYYDRLHTYQEPPLSVETALAHIYVRRGAITKWAIAIGVVVATFWGLLVAGFLPGERREAKLASRAYQDVESSVAAINKVSDEPDVEQEAAAALATAKVLRDEGKTEELKALGLKQENFLAKLMRQYELTIPSTPGEESAFPMDYTDANSKTVRSGYYVIVEARAPDGTAVKVPIRDRQTGKTNFTSRWAEQVPEGVYDRLKADKQADGLLDERVFGIKKRGERNLQVRLQGSGDDSIERGGQLTQW